MRSAEFTATTDGVLLVPVSGGTGSGELQRVRLLARAIHARWPDLAIAIAAEQHALSGSHDDGVDRVPLPHSPTRCSSEVITAIHARRPRLVVFDSTARPQQLRAAREVGAQVIYISSRPSARARGFRWGAFGCIDEHWSVELDLDAKLPNLWQRWLLRQRPALRWRPLSTLNEPADASLWSTDIRDFVAAGPYVLFCAGGGGGTLGGVRGSAAFAAAAERAGCRAVVVDPDQDSACCDALGARLRVPAQRNGALMALVQSAQLAVVGAGSLLLQTLALRSACLAVPLARDQPARLDELVRRASVATCSPTINALADTARALSTDPSALSALRERAHSLALRNGLGEALDAIGALLARPNSRM